MMLVLEVPSYQFPFMRKRCLNYQKPLNWLLVTGPLVTDYGTSHNNRSNSQRARSRYPRGRRDNRCRVPEN